MIDPLEKIRDLLVADTTLNTLVSGRIYAGEAEPPNSANYTPSLGGCVTFNATGGQTHYENGFYEPRVQVKCWGADMQEAMTVFRTLFDAVDNQVGYAVMHGRLDSGPINLRDPQSDWPYVLSFWRMKVRNTDL